MFRTLKDQARATRFSLMNEKTFDLFLKVFFFSKDETDDVEEEEEEKKKNYLCCAVPSGYVSNWIRK